MAFIDLKGREFDGLTVKSRAENSPSGKSRWLCDCKWCGGTAVVIASELLKGQKSCGCMQNATGKQAGRYRHGMSYSKDYNVWYKMIRRCRDESVPEYKNYGGRGIKVCDKWLTFDGFFEDMGERPFPKATLERKENSGHYEKSNVVWATRKEQGRNKRNNVRLEYRGESLTIGEWAERFGLNPRTLSDRITHGWSIEKALTTPVKPRSIV